SKGYPLDVQKGILIAGIEKSFENIEIFHNKTLMIFYSKYRGYITNGGRILTINCTSESLENSRKLIYNILDRGEIFFDGNFYRTDIAEKYCNLKAKQSIEAD
ncbi:MAG TPA: phosphoribosylglycinamide synthetase C domain-containing protein, partial [Exilispira sp.]|nr:phosphoribosylglycinamide synthetase C domain-containing protein [Exilispira sp.]